MIDTELLERLAGLARLGLSTKEQAALRDELEAILEHFKAIQDVDTEGVAPLAHVLSNVGEPAADEVDPYPDARARLVDLSASHREGFFVVPRVVEGPDREPGETDSGADEA
jgi:aspartyl-tRNA(Asn)/glutamyl-tRNA(Gln) amidotransferase subunit C